MKIDLLLSIVILLISHSVFAGGEGIGGTGGGNGNKKLADATNTARTPASVEEFSPYKEACLKQLNLPSDERSVIKTEDNVIIAKIDEVKKLESKIDLVDCAAYANEEKIDSMKLVLNNKIKVKPENRKPINDQRVPSSTVAQ